MTVVTTRRGVLGNGEPVSTQFTGGGAQENMRAIRIYMDGSKAAELFVRECRICLFVCILIINVIMGSCTDNDDDDFDDDDRGIWFVLSREVKWIKFHSNTKQCLLSCCSAAYSSLLLLFLKFFLFFCAAACCY